MHCCGIGVRGTGSSPGEHMRIDGHVATQLVVVLPWLSRQRRECSVILVECVSVLFLTSPQPLSSSRGFVL